MQVQNVKNDNVNFGMLKGIKCKGRFNPVKNMDDSKLASEFLDLVQTEGGRKFGEKYDYVATFRVSPFHFLHRAITLTLEPFTTKAKNIKPVKLTSEGHNNAVSLPKKIELIDVYRLGETADKEFIEKIHKINFKDIIRLIDGTSEKQAINAHKERVERITPYL